MKLHFRIQPLRARLRRLFGSSSNELEDIRITRVSLFQIDLPLFEGSYKWGGGKSVLSFDSTVVKIETSVPGLVGYGENTPLGSNYLPAYPAGTRAAIHQLAPHLLGLAPTRLGPLNDHMDNLLKGHGYAKSAIDMACWDILGKASRMPVCELIGGRYADSFLLYRAISQGSAEEMAASVDRYLKEGYRKFQLKVGGPDVKADIDRIHRVRELLDERNPSCRLPLFCDANTGWLQHEAMQVVNACKHLPATYIEQPCLSYEECLSVRRHCPLPFILDECVDDLKTLRQILADGASDAINLKISKVGGLTKARAIRDVAVAAGVALNIEDTWGGDLVTCAIAALAQSTPPRYLLCSTDFNSYGPVTFGETTCRRKGGSLSAPKEPGLGIAVDEARLGQPLWQIC